MEWARPTMDKLTTLASEIAPSTICQTFFLLAALSVISLNVLPKDARETLMDYGARRPETPGTDKRTDTQPDKEAHLVWLLNKVTSYGQIPHSWFWHFYLLSTSLSAFWAWQYLMRGTVMAFLTEKQVQSASERPPTELGRVFLAWLMLAGQGTRRLFECFSVSKPGKTPMWVVHWALALVFYSFMSVAVWVEGSGNIIESWHSQKPVVLLTARVPSTLAVFLAASLKQNECHKYLASLKKYTLPDEGLFKYVVCPHYMCECVIYLAISVMAAPPGSLYNTSVLCGLCFVAVNLGATALGTKQWYASKFGVNRVASKWRMIPGVF